MMPSANRVNAGAARQTLRRNTDRTGSLIRFMCRFDQGLAAAGRRRGLEWADRRAGLDDAQVQEQQLESHIGTRWVAHRRTSQSFLSAEHGTVPIPVPDKRTSNQPHGGGKAA